MAFQDLNLCSSSFQVCNRYLSSFYWSLDRFSSFVADPHHGAEKFNSASSIRSYITLAFALLHGFFSLFQKDCSGIGPNISLQLC
jgi:hypothetical protein